MGNPQLIQKYNNILRNNRVIQIVIGVIVCLSFGLFLFLDIASNIAIAAALSLIWTGAGGCIYWMRLRKESVSKQWQIDVTEALRPKTQIWKSEFGQFEFSMEYPVSYWNGIDVYDGVWCYVRVSEG